METPMSRSANNKKPNAEIPTPTNQPLAPTLNPAGTLKLSSGNSGKLEGFPTGEGVGGSDEVDTGSKSE